MRWTILAPAVCLAAVLAAPASAGLSDFRLPDGSAQQQPPPDRQGPVAPDVPESRRPPPTPTPTARTPAPTPAPTATAPAIVLPDRSGAERTPTPARTTRVPVPAPRPVATPSSTAAADGPAPDGGVAEDLGLPASGSTTDALPAVPPVASVAPEDEGGASWPWLLAVLALGALGFAGWTWRQRRPVSRPLGVPEVERPRLAPAAAPGPADDGLREPLQVTLEPLRLSLTLMNATLAYRLEIANRGAAPIVDLAIGADMISAHASMTREQQLSGPVAGAATLQRIERLDPGESRIVEGEFRVPFTQIVPIRQGNAALLLPLARFRLDAQGAAPVVRTFVVGQPGPKAGLQPFRLDLGPRVYPKLAQRAFA